SKIVLHHVRIDSTFFFSSRRRHTRFSRDWSSDVCSSDLFTRRPVRGRRVHSGGTSDGSGRYFPAAAVTAEEKRVDARQGVRPDEIGRASCRERESFAREGGSLDVYRETIQNDLRVTQGQD